MKSNIWAGTIGWNRSRRTGMISGGIISRLAWKNHTREQSAKKQEQRSNKIWNIMRENSGAAGRRYRTIWKIMREHSGPAGSIFPTIWKIMRENSGPAGTKLLFFTSEECVHVVPLYVMKLMMCSRDANVVVVYILIHDICILIHSCTCIPVV